MSKRWAKGSTRSWRKVRKFVLDRDGHRCRLRLARCTVIATQVHHTRPREVVGDDPAYLVAACGGCNRKAGAPDKAPDPEVPTVGRWF